MRKTIQIICIAILFFPVVLLSQPNFYGLTNAGGQGVGTIFNFQSATKTLTSVFNFPNPAANPVNSMVLANNGMYYGTTRAGGSSDAGEIYSFDKSTNTRTDLVSFNITKGAAPYGSMIKAANGKLYGTTVDGGTYGMGVIYGFNTATNTQTKLFDFDTLSGAHPYASLMQAGNGKLYGTTNTGGTNNLGALFSFDPVSNTYAKLYDFDAIHGSFPYSGLIEFSSGKFYGLTAGGGSGNYGTLFSFDLAGNTLVKVVDFNNANGAYPYSNLVKASNGKLYGTTQSGGNYSGTNGTLFSFDPATNNHVKLYDFNTAFQNGSDPAYPLGGLVQADNGKLYGTTSNGGTYPDYGGTLFSFDLATNIPSFYLVFNNDIGIAPYCTLVKDANGKLYGVTPYGGKQQYGTIFSFDPVSNINTKLSDFKTPNGMGPVGGLVLADNGKYYGMTQYGGDSINGTIFSFDPATNIQTNVFSFNGNNGELPFASLMKSSNGKLYGMTTYGGTNGGTLFSFDPATNTHVKMRDLGGPEGYAPTGGLVEASNGKLYGMTKAGGGGTFQVGTIFSYDILTNIPTKVFGFDSTSGYVPYGGLIQATNGKLYGMTFQGGSKDSGTAFSFDPANNAFTKILDFGAPFGTYATSNFVQASNGILYGMTEAGGLNDLGTIFSVDPATNAVVKLYDFEGTNGSRPLGKLVQAVNGKLYGLTWDGGSKNNGVVFSYDITNGVYTKLQDFIGTNGAAPYNDSYLSEQSSCTIIPPTIKANGSLKICNNNSVTLSTSKPGNAISLSNTGNKYISVSHSASNNISAGTAFTIEAWINVTDNVNNTIVDKGDYDFLFQTHSNGHTGLGFYNRNFGWIFSAGTVPLNQWVHVAVTYNNQTLKFYQNGVLQGTYTTPAITLGDNGPMNIGRQQPSACACNILDGSVDELRLWNVARTQAQLQANMNANVPTNSAGLKAYYKFDDNAGPVAKDVTANGNNGTLVNNPAWIVPSSSPVGYSSFLWSNGATTPAITVSASATYTVTVTNANGCTGSTSAIVTKSTSPTVTVTPASATVCTPSTSIMLTAGGTASYFSWSPGASLNQTTGSSVTANPTATTTYFVTGANAAGCTASKNVKVTVNPKPVNTITTNITPTGAVTNWDVISCASGYTVQYKKASVATWTTLQINTNFNSKALAGLDPSTVYNWRVKAKFSNGATSGYTTPVNFTTLALREGEVAASAQLILYPNPSTGSITIQLTACENCTSTVNVYDVLGQMVFTETRKAGGNGTYDLSKLPKGVYQVRVSYNEGNQYCKLVLQ